MSTIIRWLSPDNTSLIIEFAENNSWAEFRRSVQHAHHMIEIIPHQVTLIIWDRAGIPAGNPLQHFQQVFREQPKNVGSVIIIPTLVGVGTLAFMKRLTEVTDRIFPSKSRIKFARTFEEAQSMVKSVAAESVNTASNLSG